MPRRTPPRTAECPLLLATLLVLLLPGCASDESASPGRPVAPAATGGAIQANPASPAPGGMFYPLTEGNRWRYSGQIVLRFTDGSDPLVVNRTDEREIVGTEELFGRVYTIERQELVEDTSPGDPIRSWIRYRQDRSGLYEADVATCDPPGAADCPGVGGAGRLLAARAAAGHPSLDDAALRLLARRDAVLAALRGGFAATRAGGPLLAGGPFPEELVRFQYPLHPGAEWTIRADPLFRSHVEAHEVVTVPAGRFAAWRVVITLPDLAGPNDRFEFWYGRAGLVMIRLHFELAEGVLDDVQVLESLELHGPGGGAAS